MIRVGSNSVKAAYIGDIPVSAMYFNEERIWPDMVGGISCFANGYWIDEYPWTDDLPWSDG